MWNNFQLWSSLIIQIKCKFFSKNGNIAKKVSKLMNHIYKIKSTKYLHFFNKGLKWPTSKNLHIYTHTQTTRLIVKCENENLMITHNDNENITYSPLHVKIVISRQCRSFNLWLSCRPPNMYTLSLRTAAAWAALALGKLP